MNVASGLKRLKNPVLLHVDFRNIFATPAHLDLSITHEGTLENFASPIWGAKLYMAISMHLHANSCPTPMQATESKT
jgi:hypothetical protein